MKRLNINNKKLVYLYFRDIRIARIADIFGTDTSLIYRRLKELYIKPNRKTGRVLKPNGYVYIQSPNHPFHDKGGYVREHHLVVERQLGRYLSKGEVVHHINGIRHDNRISNLMVMTTSEHGRLENSGTNNPFYGRKHSLESRLKIKEARKRQVGANASFYGRHHSEETKRKISETKRRKYATR
jgi:hypothetical protein